MSEERLSVLENFVRGEMAEKDLDRMIERRSRGVDVDEHEELWKEGVRKYRARHREERLRDQAAYHEAMLEAHTRNFEELMRRHRVGLRACEEALGLPISEQTEGDAA